MDFLFSPTLTPERKLEMYQACLDEFERLQYDDPYVAEIRREAEKLKHKQQKPS
ncbi:MULTISPECIES: hypothetical protein [Shewanella]|uniref:Uncharacterized protein n=2 Tax=Shewanella TaxID=22 RepID=A0AAJ1F106_9GAMM|nr:MULTISPECIES: hypothetical protein [Shewanella]MCH4295147.1 hypothetical protein [Shewanella zhuhaiensis]